MKPTTLNIVIAILGLGFLACLGGIILLASQNPARSIPDILVGTTTLIVGGLIGLLVPSKPTGVSDEGGMAVSELCLIVIAVGVVVFVPFGANLVSR